MKKKIFVMLVGVVLLVGIISGCVEEEEPTPTNEAPTAGFTVPDNVYMNTAFTFTDTSTDDVGIESWSWDFDGDGTEDSTDQNPTHTYTATGDYVVNLTVTDAEGETSTATKTVTVGYTPPSVNIEYSYDTTNLTVDSVITFMANVTEGDANISSYDWDFGDGNTSNETSPTHTYETADDYIVTVIVTDENTLAGTHTETITVGESEA